MSTALHPVTRETPKTNSDTDKGTECVQELRFVIFPAILCSKEKVFLLFFVKKWRENDENKKVVFCQTCTDSKVHGAR